ncbi:hypothetical protein C9374_010723 [Naegleria lovaniensis]|uniref:Uncharacterized protein n=1 Tax=Naegleria lovaniensis TaxID=51637 RepID=A0AA88GFM5_NAELO|nr:uncharacterized protein C9374_010723 [Naegleria lovaniensis]KAG2374439.1 hypothetical protein C9374_010723 [Naegleria lovaniensis]
MFHVRATRDMVQQQQPTQLSSSFLLLITLFFVGLILSPCTAEIHPNSIHVVDSSPPSDNLHLQKDPTSRWHKKPSIAETMGMNPFQIMMFASPENQDSSSSPSRTDSLNSMMRSYYQNNENAKVDSSSSSTTANSKGKGYPLILVGGLGGVVLMSKRDHASEPHWWCQHTTDPFQIWISIEELVPYLSEDCFMHDLSLELKEGESPYDRKKLLRQLDPHVKIFGKDYGGVESVTHLVKEAGSQSGYMIKLINFLTSNGYEIGKSLRAMPYDWRLGVAEWSAPNSSTTGGDYHAFQKLIEETYALNGNVPVSLLGHSMGGPFVQYFLANYVSQTWKDKFISHYIPFAGAFDGAPIALPLALAGSNYGVPTFSQTIAKKLTQQFGGPNFMIPIMSQHFDYPIFTYLSPNGTRQDYYATPSSVQQLYKDANMEKTWDVFEHEYSEYASVKFRAPNVSTHCVYGYGVKSLAHLQYSGQKPLSEILFDDILHHSEALKIDDGDGTVPLYSLAICDDFAKQQQQPVMVHRFFNVTHLTVVTDDKVLQTLLDILNTPIA